MQLFEDIFFKALFNTAVPRVILKADAPNFTIISYNDAYKEVTHTQHRDITGMFLWQAFEPKDAGENGRKLLLDALIKASLTNETVTTPPFQYDILNEDGAETILSWWQLEIIPVSDREGNLQYLLTTTYNITADKLREQSINEGKLREQNLNEEIVSINEELAATNEELSEVNEDLLESQENLIKLNKELEVRVNKRTRELVASNIRLKSIFEQSPLGFYVLNGPELIIELANDYMLKLWNTSREVIGKPYSTVRAEPNSFLSVLNEVYQSGIAFKKDEVKLEITDDNVSSKQYFNIIYQPIKNEQNLTSGILAIIENVSEKIEGREKTKRIDGQLHMAVEAAKIGSWNIDAETKTLQYNSMLAKLFGYESDKPMTYDQAIQQVTEEYREQLIHEIERAIDDGGNYDITYAQHRFNDNKLIWLRSLGKVTQDETGNYLVFSGVVMDITEQLEATRKIEAKQHQLNMMVMTAPIGTAVLRGRNFLVDVANGPILKMWERNYEQVEGKPIIEIFPELKDQPFPKMLEEVFDSGIRMAISEIDVSFSTPAGLKNLALDFSYDPLFDKDGDVEAILVTVKDITEIVEARKSLELSKEDQQRLNDQLMAINEEMVAVNEELYQAQEDLVRTLGEVAESESRLRYLLEDAPVAIGVMKGRDLIVEAANKKTLEIWGKSNEVIGKRLDVALPELQGQPFLSYLDNVYTTGESFVGNELMALLERNGKIEEVYLNFVYHALKGADGKTNSIMLVATEVTDQVKAKQRIENSQQQFRQAVDSANLGTWSINPERNHLSLSDRSKELFGIPLEEEVSFAEAMEAVDSDYQELVHSTVTRGLTKYESCDIEYPIDSLISKQRKWLRVTGKMFFDSVGKPAHYSGIIMEITDRKLEEQRKDDFISVASHELKTPVTTLKGSLQLLKRMKDKASPEVMSNFIDQANRSMDKVTDLIDNFLNMNRLSDGQMPLNETTFNISEMLEGCCNHVRMVGHFELIFKGDRELECFADKDRIEQVVINFVNNAVKYAPGSTQIYLIAEKMDDWVKVSVKDSGPGIPPEKLAHLFGRYYRADNSGYQYSGLGLGLYISAEIIKRHHGKIGVDSELGKGSTFWFKLPVC